VTPLNLPEFREAYPQFVVFNDTQLNLLWMQAQVFGGFLNNIFVRKEDVVYWQQLVLAHLCAISPQGKGGDSPVGRISSASEGSVSGSFDFPMSNTSAWWQQSQYGATVYQLMIMRGGYTYVSAC
jgi:Protein of unknown function (DUF4054)